MLDSHANTKDNNIIDIHELGHSTYTVARFPRAFEFSALTLTRFLFRFPLPHIEFILSLP